MNWKAYVPLAVAVVLGLLAARVAMTLVASGPPKILETPNLVPVAVTGRDIEPGTTLAETDLVLTKLPADTLPAGAFTSIGQSIGRVTKIALVRGQTVTPNLLADDGAGYGVGATLPAGMRAVTVDITDTTGVAGFIMPKCRVDVIATLQVEGKSIAKTVLEGVSVLAVGGRTNPTAPIDPAAPPSKTVTLLVKPKDVEKVELAATMSRIRLVLRNGKDDSVADSEGITLAELKGRRDTDPFGDDAAIRSTAATTQPASPVQMIGFPTPTTRPAVTNWTVQVIKAGVVSQQNFETKAEDMPAEAAKPSEVTHTVASTVAGTANDAGFETEQGVADDMADIEAPLNTADVTHEAH